MRRLARLLDSESPRPVAALEVLEAVDGDAGGAGCELEEAGFLLGVPAADTLYETKVELVKDIWLGILSSEWDGGGGG